jgi:type IV pilus assembly protein PilN
MLEINLLPVREEKRKADVRQFALLLGGTFAGSLALVGMMHTKMVAQVAFTKSSLVELQAEIDKFKPQLEQVERYRATKQAIEAKLEVIERLERSRSGPVHMLEELAIHAPDRLWLTGLKAEHGQMTVKGMSLDNELVALFMTALGGSPYFENVELQETEAKDVDGLRLNEFSVSAAIEIPGVEPEPAAAPGAPGAPGTPKAPNKRGAAASTGN